MAWPLNGPFPSGSTVKFVAAGLGLVDVVLAFLVVVVGLVVACPWVVVPGLVVAVVVGVTMVVPVPVGLGIQDPLDCLLTFLIEDLFRTSCRD